MKAIPDEDQPVLLVKVAKTKVGGWWEGALAGAAIRIVKKEINEMYKAHLAISGRGLLLALKKATARLTSSKVRTTCQG